MKSVWGQRLRKARGTRTVDEVASQAGISYSYLYALEAGTYDPSYTVKVQLAQALGLRTAELWSYNGDPAP